MGFEEMGPTQAEWDIAKIIEAHVGYETPVQWRIAKELAQREETVLASQPVKQDMETTERLNDLVRRIGIIRDYIDKMSRYVPVYRSTLVKLHNDAMGFETEKPKTWWRFRTFSSDPVGERHLARVFVATLIFILSVTLWAYVKS